jgi:hypothetical protein
MIVDWRVGNVLDGPERHLAFPINVEGKPGVGLDGTIADNYMPELEQTGPLRMGTILSREVGQKFFHGLVVHSLTNWAEAPKHIEACFNELEISTDEEVASIVMGGGTEGQRVGAETAKNLGAMARSNKSIAIYSFFNNLVEDLAIPRRR